MEPVSILSRTTLIDEETNRPLRKVAETPAAPDTEYVVDWQCCINAMLDALH